MTSLHLALALGTSVGALLLTPQGDDSYTGTWKLNVAKSKFTGQRDKVAAAGANAWTFSYGTSSWTVKTDGSDTPTPFGNTVALQAESPTTWRFSWKAPNGQALATETWTLSADGKSMSRVSSGTRESGERFSDTTQMNASRELKDSPAPGRPPSSRSQHPLSSLPARPPRVWISRCPLRTSRSHARTTESQMPPTALASPPVRRLHARSVASQFNSL